MFRRMLAAGLALTLVVCAGPAVAVPKPRKDQWWMSAMGVQDAWKRSTGRGVTIALIDTRPNTELPEFRGADIRSGRSFDKKKPMLPGYEDGYEDFVLKNKDHGTSMLAAMVAQGHGSGYVGVAPDVTVLTIPHDLAQEYRTAIRYAVDQGADIVSMSFGGAVPVVSQRVCETNLQEAITYASERDTILVAAVGNNKTGADAFIEPGMCPGVLTVAGLSRDLEPRKNALKKEYIDVAAPSEEVLSLQHSGALLKGDGGTSTATAFTSASLALIRAAHPDESARQIVSRLLYAAQDVHTPGHDPVTGFGLIRPDLAIDATVPAGFVNPVYDGLDTFNREKAEAQDRIDNPPPFTVGARPPGSDTARSDWETYGPWLLGAGLLAVAAGLVSVLVVFRRRR